MVHSLGANGAQNAGWKIGVRQGLLKSLVVLDLFPVIVAVEVWCDLFRNK